MLVSVVDDDQSPRKSTPIDMDEKGATSVVNDEDPLENNNNQRARADVGDEHKEISQSERYINTRHGEDKSKPSNQKSNSQSKGKKKNKKKASKGIGCAQSTIKGKEAKIEEPSSSEGI